MIQKSNRRTIGKPIRFSLCQSFPFSQPTRLKRYSSQSGDFEDNNGVSLSNQAVSRTIMVSLGILMQYRAISRIGRARCHGGGISGTYFTTTRKSVTVSGLRFPRSSSSSYGFPPHLSPEMGAGCESVGACRASDVHPAACQPREHWRRCNLCSFRFDTTEHLPAALAGPSVLIRRPSSLGGGGFHD